MAITNNYITIPTWIK